MLKRTSSGRLGLLVLFGVLHLGATRNEPSTEVTVGLGGGQFEYVPGGCASYHRGTEIASFVGVRHEWEGHLAADGGLTLAPGVTESPPGSYEPATEAHFAGALAGRLGGRWPWVSFMVGPQLFWHPQLAAGATPLPFLSADLKLGPDRVYAWGSLLPQPGWSLLPGNLQWGVGSRGALGNLEVGMLTPAEGWVGGVVRGQAEVAGGWRLGGQAGLHNIGRTFPGPDWRVMVLATKRWTPASPDREPASTEPADPGPSAP